MKTNKKRLMLIEYICKDELIQKLKSNLNNYDVRYVIFNEYDIGKEYALYRIYIDKNNCIWRQVMKAVNDVKPTKFKYVSNHYIENGKIYFR